MNIEQTSKTDYEDGGPVKSGVKAKQGDRRTMTFWILIISTVLAGIGGWILLSTTEDYTADKSSPTENSAGPKSPPMLRGQGAG